MNTAEISQLLQITLEIPIVVGGYGGGIKISNKSSLINSLYFIDIIHLNDFI